MSVSEPEVEVIAYKVTCSFPARFGTASVWLIVKRIYGGRWIVTEDDPRLTVRYGPDGQYGTSGYEFDLETAMQIAREVAYDQAVKAAARTKADG